MARPAEFEEINDAKAEMDHIYNEPDPRPYFWELEEFRYQIPDAAKPIFDRLIQVRERDRDGPARVLDLGSSYGTMAALLKHDLTMRDLYAHWSRRHAEGLSTAEVLHRDRNRFAHGKTDRPLAIIGLDPAEMAIEYGLKAGLLDAGFSLNLEEDELTPELTQSLEGVDLVTSTGCVGYITEKTFNRLMPELTKGRPAWIANFVLRMFPFDTIEKNLAAWGYKTEKLQGRSFIQRRFTSETEQAQVIEELHRQGIDTSGKEDDGFLMAEFFLARPIAEAEACPIGRLLET